MFLHILGLGSIFVALVGQVSGHPACGIGIGEDVCAYKRVIPRLPLVVRPVELPRPTIEPVTKPPAIVTPVPTLPPIPVPPLLPIGGPCSCKQTIVKPAIVPKPVCQTATCNSGSSCSTCNTCNSCSTCNTCNTCNTCTQNVNNKMVIGGGSSSGVAGIVSGIAGSVLEGVSGGSYLDGMSGMSGMSSMSGMSGMSGSSVVTGVSGSSCSDSSASGSNSVVGFDSYGYQSGNNNPANVPADAVSLSIAYNMAKKAAATQNEDRLFFGFRQMPKEVPRREIKRIIGQRFPDEGNIYRLNGEIVELKTVPTSTPKSLAEEAAEDLMDMIAEEQEENVDYVAPVRKLSLGEIGYGPAKLKTPAFVDIPAAVSEAVQDTAEAVAESIGGVASSNGVCQDGFQAGSVAVAQVPQLEPMLSRPKLEATLEPCDDSIEDALVSIEPVAVQYTSCSSNSRSSSSSSSSSSSLFQRVMSKLS